MPPNDATDFSHTIRVDRLPPKGLDFEWKGTPAQLAKYAELLELPEVHEVWSRLHVARDLHDKKRVRVTGRVFARVTQTCVVSLEPFEEIYDEEIAAEFAEDAPVQDWPANWHEAEPQEIANAMAAMDLDAPDPIVDGKIDLGMLVYEIVALGIDPYPHKSGVAFDPQPEEERETPFGVLGEIKPGTHD